MRSVEEKTFRTHDGIELFYRYCVVERQQTSVWANGGVEVTLEPVRE